ncbi:molybdopterin oxidoreductase [Chloroherpeton thalassium ATCC 35110]|uniref:Molybdopterin oxidoreductase n=1 Tax=Chloroherpeton thalassium (strain ATCC 35110 / GB-78) TaxID=517418 RepID=B3QTV7_CHLT3|nr:molybdopterin-dependent oxidoreductase [Chloroherpeton thalassium]ACF14305.1 molybdopterin oxidoreductase [Chloroherpeton thalassium ATCC 35110]
MNKKITRRQFLKAAGVLGGMALLRPIWDLGSETAAVQAQSISSETTWVPSICNFCSSFCDINVAVKKVDGVKRVVKIEGNKNSPLNRGKICARGQAGLRQTYDPDRLKQPMIRVEGSKRGEWDFRAVTWDEAYDYVVKKLKKVNPWEISLVGGWTACVSYMHFSLPFVKTLEIPNIIASPLQHCVTAGHLGTDLVTGNFNVHDEILADFENARYILFSMNNASVAAISTARAVRFGQAKKNGAKVVCLDPRQSELASKADEWLPIKPGTDHAFFLAMLHILLREQLYDKSFIQKHTNAPFLAFKDKNGLVQLAADMGRDGKPSAYYVYDEVTGKITAVPAYTNTNEFANSRQKQRVLPAIEAPKKLSWKGQKVQTVFDFFVEESEPYTAEWAAEITEIPAETIERIAVEFGQARPAMVDPGWMGSRYHHVIGQRRLQAIIQTLVGGVDRKGGWLMNGEYRHKAEAAWEMVQHGHQGKEGSPVGAPGMGFANALLDLFGNPKAWPHGKPGLGFAWAEEMHKQGKPSAFLPAMADVGLPEAVRGEFTYNGEPYNMKVFFMNAANPIRHYFPAKRWEEMLSHENVELVVAVDVLPSDTTLYADVILPNHTYLERNEPLLYPLGPDTNLGFTTRIRAIDPLYETRDAADIFCEIAERMGKLGPYIEGVASFSGLDMEVLKKEIVNAKAKGQPLNEAFLRTSYETMGHLVEHVTGKKMTAEEVEKKIHKDGVLVLKSADELLEEASMPRKIPVPTASGRLELYSPILASFAQATLKQSKKVEPIFNPILGYVPRVVSDKEKESLEKDEFYFTYGKVPVVSHASTNNNNALLSAVTKPKEGAFIGLWMNARKAAELGLKNGERVEIENLRYGQKVTATLFATEMIRPDTVFLPSAYGSRNKKLSIAGGKGTALNELMPYSIEPIAASFMSQEFTVRIRSAQSEKEVS